MLMLRSSERGTLAVFPNRGNDSPAKCSMLELPTWVCLEGNVKLTAAGETFSSR